MQVDLLRKFTKEQFDLGLLCLPITFLSENTIGHSFLQAQDSPVIHASIPTDTDPPYDILSDEDTTNEDEDTTNEDEPGCVWYGQCGPGFNPDTNLNCPATNETRKPPKLTNPTGLKLLKKYCPKLYKGRA